MRGFPLWFMQADSSKAFLEAHREVITLHKAAKAAFDEAGLQKLPKVKEKRTPPRKPRPAKRVPPRSFPGWEASPADFFVKHEHALIVNSVHKHKLLKCFCHNVTIHTRYVGIYTVQKAADNMMRSRLQ